jgi:hypothetical protein
MILFSFNLQSSVLLLSAEVPAKRISFPLRPKPCALRLSFILTPQINCPIMRLFMSYQPHVFNLERFKSPPVSFIIK